MLLKDHKLNDVDGYLLLSSTPQPRVFNTKPKEATFYAACAPQHHVATRSKSTFIRPITVLAAHSAPTDRPTLGNHSQRPQWTMSS